MPTEKTKSQLKNVKLNILARTQKRITGSIHTLLIYVLATVGWFKKIPDWFKYRSQAITALLKNDRKKKKYRSFRLQKKIKPEARYLPPPLKLLKESLKFLYTFKRIFFVIILIHGILYVTVIRSPITTNISTIQDSIKSAFGDTRSVSGTVATLGAVVGATGNTQVNSTITAISVLLMSLVYIWAIRQLHAGKLIKARDAYYQGMTSIVPSALILIVISLQLIPFAVASFVYTTARAGGLFASGFEDLSFFIITLLAGLLSFYWMTSTIIALYVVTLPGMYPFQALRAAKKLVQFQRTVVFKRVLALPILLGLAYLALLLLVIRVVSSQVFIIVELLQLLILPLIHTYLYKLYRALI